MNVMKAFVDVNWDIGYKELVIRMGWGLEVRCRSTISEEMLWQPQNLADGSNFLHWEHAWTAASIRITMSERELYTNSRAFHWPLQHGEVYFISQFLPMVPDDISLWNHQLSRWHSPTIQSSTRALKCLMISCEDVHLPPYWRCLHIAISKSGHPSHGQGYDFLLEEENGSVLKWIRRGVATDDVWLSCMRNTENFEAIHAVMNETLAFDSHQTAHKKIDLSDAITEWRVCLRDSVPVFNDNDLVSLSGEPLD